MAAAFLAVLSAIALGGSDRFRSTDSRKPFPPIGLSRDPGVFAMCLSGMDPRDQVETLMGMGYREMAIESIDPAAMRAFLEVPAVASGGFRVVAAMMWTNARGPLPDSSSLEASFEAARKLGCAVWMVIDADDRKSSTVQEARRLIQSVADRASRRGVEFVLYPHGGTLVATAEEALAMVRSLDSPARESARISIHLCHEMVAGNGGRIEDVVRRTAPFAALATVSGADIDPSADGGDWSRAIKPLDRGSYDVRPFLAALARFGYKGPVEIHTYGLPSPRSANYDHHLERSLAWWRSSVGLARR